MKFYLKDTKNAFNAVAEYNDVEKTFTVLKGSIISDCISSSPTFRGKNMVARLRDKNVKDRIVTCDVVFKSPSTAGNFIKGTSTNGCIAWKDESGRTFKDVFGDKKNERNEG